jgi:hypothetical protein
VRYVYTAHTLIDAYMMRDLLTDAGIRCAIFNEHSAGALGELPYTESWPQIWIYQEMHGERARSLLDDFEKQSSGDQPVMCDQCGEPGPAGFETCWNCGQDIP